MRRPSPSVRRAGWAIGDQAFSSLTNFALGVLVARSVDLAAFGAFSLAFAAYLLVVSVTRAYPMDPLAIRYAAAPPEAFRRSASSATGTVVVVGVVCGVVALAIGLVTSGPFSESLLALSVAFPGLLLQDAWRSTFFAAGNGRSALVNDLVWAAVEFPALALVLAAGHGSVFWAVVAWAGAANVAAVFGIVQASLVPRPWLAGRWWRENTHLGPRFIAEAISRVVAGQIQLYGVGLAAGLAAVGTLRAGQLLFGPVQVVAFGVSMMAVPEGARALVVSLGRLRRVTIVISGGLAAGAVAWGILVALVPADLGRLLLRDAWDPARSLLAPLLVYSIGVTLSYGSGAAVRTLAAAGRSLRATLVTSTLTLVLGIAGAALAGASGAAWGLSAVGAVGAIIWWFEYRGAERDHVAGAVLRQAPEASAPRAGDGSPQPNPPKFG